MNPFPRHAKLAVAFASLLISLSGCASQKNAQGPVFFPPAPNLPRVQYLKGISSSADVEPSSNSVSLFSIGQVDRKKVRPIIKPYGVAASAGRIYVADLAGQILIMDLAKQTFEKLKGDNGTGKLKKPVNLAADRLGYLFVADIGRKEIMVYDPQGEFVKAVGGEHDMNPGGVAVDDDRIYVLDIRHRAIRVFDRESYELIKEIGKGDDPEKSLSMPITMVMDKKGIIRVTNAGNGKVMSYDRDGHFLGAFGQMGDGFGQFSRPKGITADGNGYLYVVDAAFQNVQVLTEQGRILMYFGGAKGYGGMNLPAGIALSSDNLEYFQGLADKDFELEQVIVVANQFGDPKLSIYGFGKQRGIDYDKEYKRIQEDRERKARAELEKRKASDAPKKEQGGASR